MTIATISNGETVTSVTSKLNELIGVGNKALLNDAANVVTEAAAGALVVGPNGATNPTLKVDTSAENAATGVSVTAAAAAGGVTIAALSSGDNENITIAPKGTGSVVISKADINGGAIDGTTIGASAAGAATFTTLGATTSTVTTSNATTFDTNVAAAGVTLTGVTLAADGTDENININITPKGTGEVNITKADIDAGTIDGVTLGNTCVYIVPTSDPGVAGALWYDVDTLKVSLGT